MNSEYQKTYDDIIAVPLPEATETYVPVPNKTVADQIYARIIKEGYDYMGAGYRLAAKDQVAAGLIAVKPKTFADMGVVHNISWLNSYNKRRKLSLGSGALILACSNGMFTQKLYSGTDRKHQGNVLNEIEMMLDKVFADLDMRFEMLIEQINILKNTQVEMEILWQMIGSMLMGNIIPISAINPLKKNLRKDKNFQMLGEGGDMTAWNMYNQVTEILKPTPAYNLVDAHVNAHDLVSQILVEGGLISGDNVALFSDYKIIEDSEQNNEQLEQTVVETTGAPMEEVEKLPDEVAATMVDPDHSVTEAKF